MNQEETKTEMTQSDAFVLDCKKMMKISKKYRRLHMILLKLNKEMFEKWNVNTSEILDTSKMMSFNKDNKTVSFK